MRNPAQATNAGMQILHSNRARGAAGRAARTAPRPDGTAVWTPTSITPSGPVTILRAGMPSNPRTTGPRGPGEPMIPDQCMAARRIGQTELQPQHRSIQVDRFSECITSTFPAADVQDART
jgi:hypothetical protein